MNLYVWPGEFGLPSVDIECLQFMAATKFCAAPITFHLSTQPWTSPKGDLPYFDNNGEEQIIDFTEFVEFLRNSRQDVVLDNDLVPSQLCEFEAYTFLLKQKLMPALNQLFWADKYNYGTIVHPLYAQQLMFPYNIYHLERKRKRMETPVKISRKSQQQLTLDAIQALNLLSLKLSDNKYFCGDKPCSIDALVFGYLAPLLRTPLPNDRLQLHLSATPNLVRFVDSVLNIYLPLPDKIAKEQAMTRKVWQKLKMNAQQTMEEGRIEREQRMAEKKRHSPLYHILFFAFSSVTISLLFAVHTGIITVDSVDHKGKKANR
uniref:Metaxin n=1 Tax=Globodera rostochiensis TaxID=31243 RepID=A0A914HSS2_GLORO